MIHIMTLKRKAKSCHGLCGFKVEYARLYIINRIVFDDYYLNGKQVLFERVKEMKGEWEFCYEALL
jgi:hypothetical protein